MTDVTLSRPAGGQQIIVRDFAEACFVLTFPLETAQLERMDNSLVFLFPDDALVVLNNFYTTFSRETLPTFEINGIAVPGGLLLSELGEQLLPPPTLMALSAHDVSAEATLLLFNEDEELEGQLLFDSPIESRAAPDATLLPLPPLHASFPFENSLTPEEELTFLDEIRRHDDSLSPLFASNNEEMEVNFAHDAGVGSPTQGLSATHADSHWLSQNEDMDLLVLSTLLEHP